MKHARDDYATIQHDDAAMKLADLILSMEMRTSKGLVARRLAREVLGIDDHGTGDATLTPVTTNGTTRLIPRDEPVFLIRAQDAVSGDAVRAWADLAEAKGAAPEILQRARAHAALMDAWPTKKTPDLPTHGTAPQ
jgi:hypothetical protein